MFLTKHFIFAIMPLLGGDLVIVTIEINSVILCTKKVGNTVAMLLLSFCCGNDAMHTAVEILSGEEAQTVANIDDGVLRLGLDELPFVIIWR